MGPTMVRSLKEIGPGVAELRRFEDFEGTKGTEQPVGLPTVSAQGS